MGTMGVGNSGRAEAGSLVPISKQWLCFHRLNYYVCK